MKESILSTSKRKYEIAELENNRTIVYEKTLSEIMLDGKFETMFALQDIMDDVLDLRKGESLYFQPNRDLNRSKAIIVRIN